MSRSLISPRNSQVYLPGGKGYFYYSFITLALLFIGAKGVESWIPGPAHQYLPVNMPPENYFTGCDFPEDFPRPVVANSLPMKTIIIGEDSLYWHEVTLIPLCLRLPEEDYHPVLQPEGFHRVGKSAETFSSLVDQTTGQAMVFKFLPCARYQDFVTAFDISRTKGVKKYAAWPFEPEELPYLPHR